MNVKSATVNRLKSPEVLLGVLTLLIVVFAYLLRPADYARGSVDDPQNPEPQGMMAVAEVLQDHGVSLDVTRTVSATLRSSNDLLIITRPDRLSDTQLHELAELQIDTVIIGASRSVAGFADKLDREQASAGAYEAGCLDPRLQAGEIDTIGPFLTHSEADVCFPGPEYGAVLTLEADGRLISLAPADIFHNDHILNESNAAIALALLGSADTATWLVGDLMDSSGWDKQADEESFDISWLSAAIFATLLAAIWAFGPRFGRLLSEPLPVTVNASETTIGRGHLYRQSRDLNHSATTLRVSALSSMAPRLGISPNATPEHVINQIAPLTSQSQETIRSILYGPPPTTDDSLRALALSLDALVNEVEQK